MHVRIEFDYDENEPQTPLDRVINTDPADGPYNYGELLRDTIIAALNDDTDLRAMGYWISHHSNVRVTVEPF